MSEDSPKLAVIVPTHDRLRLLQRAVAGVTTQTYKNFRAIIVNNGSTDGTQEYLDTLTDPRVRVLQFESNRGVNMARNAAAATLADDEWAIMLDDDDELLPNALGTIANVIAESPSRTEMLFFGTRIKTSEEEFEGGYQFAPTERFHDPTYLEVFTKARMHGDSKPVIRGSVFRTYHFNEDVNGFESEFYNLLARDGVGIRYERDAIMRVDQSHGGERLSESAAKRDPASFVRATKRILVDHRRMYETHPRLAMSRALSGLKVALRAGDIPSALGFSFTYIHSLLRLPFRDRA